MPTGGRNYRPNKYVVPIGSFAGNPSSTKMWEFAWEIQCLFQIVASPYISHSKEPKTKPILYHHMDHYCHWAWLWGWTSCKIWCSNLFFKCENAVEHTMKNDGYLRHVGTRETPVIMSDIAWITLIMRCSERVRRLMTHWHTDAKPTSRTHRDNGVHPHRSDNDTVPTETRANTVRGSVQKVNDKNQLRLRTSLNAEENHDYHSCEQKQWWWWWWWWSLCNRHNWTCDEQCECKFMRRCRTRCRNKWICKASQAPSWRLERRSSSSKCRIWIHSERRERKTRRIRSWKLKRLEYPSRDSALNNSDNGQPHCHNGTSCVTNSMKQQ